MQRFIVLVSHHDICYRTRPKGSKVLVVVVMVGSRTVLQRRYRSCPRIRLLPRQQEPRLDRHCQLEWARCSWSLSGHLGPVIFVYCRNHGSLDYVRIMQFSTLSISTRLCNSPSCYLEQKLHGDEHVADTSPQSPQHS